MCNQCPTPEELFRSIDQRIDAGRWQVIGVMTTTPWAYTIGLVEGFGHPELFLTGAYCVPCAHNLLNDVGALIAEGERFDVPTVEPVHLGVDRFHVRPVEGAPLTGGWFGAWHGYYGSKPWAPPALAVSQLVIPDDRERYPWEPGCDQWVAGVQQVPDEPPRPTRAQRRSTHRFRDCRR